MKNLNVFHRLALEKKGISCLRVPAEDTVSQLNRELTVMGKILAQPSPV